MTSTLPYFIEHNDQLASFLGISDVLLIREDKLPDLGGKKRRSLVPLFEGIREKEHIHILSYSSSHTALTLAKLFPERRIVLYGMNFIGGKYKYFMEKYLQSRDNVTLIRGNIFVLLLKFYRNMWFKQEDYFMKFGGSVHIDKEYEHLMTQLKNKIGRDYVHFVPVASGSMYQAIKKTFNNTFGILTQPWFIRWEMWLKSTSLKGLIPVDIRKREVCVNEIFKETGQTFDPVFMGSTLTYIQKMKKKPEKICLWVTSPSLVKEYFLVMSNS